MSASRPLSDWVHELLSRSDLMVRLAIAVRNQARCIIKHRLTDGTDPRSNGEAWVASRLGEEVSFFVDVGANVGDWTQMMFDRVGGTTRGVLFEPSTSALVVLRERFGDEARVEIRDCALGDEFEEMDFCEVPEAGPTSSLVSTRNGDLGTVRKVQVSTLDREFELDEIPRSSMLKIDAEGFDLNVLRGAERLISSRVFAAIQFEYNDIWAAAGSTLRAALELLDRYGYTVFLLRRDALESFEYEILGEYFTYSNFVALRTDIVQKFGAVGDFDGTDSG